MRKFHSYGPIDSEEHYYVERKDLVDQCTNQLIGNIKKGGHYFTIWGARQTGKTWLYRQSLERIKRQLGDQYIVGEISMQGIVKKKDDDHDQLFFNTIPELLKEEFSIAPPAIKS